MGQSRNFKKKTYKTSTAGLKLYSFIKNWLFLSLLTSGLLILSFPTPGLYPIAWFSMVPYFFMLFRSNLKRAFFGSLIVNFVFNTVYLIWLKEYNHPLTLPLSVFAEYLYFFPATFISWIIIRYFPFRLRALCIAATWVFFDYLKTVGFLAFPWGILGYTQYRNIVMIQITSIFGVWGIDFLVLYFNITIAGALLSLDRGESIRRNGMDIVVLVLFLITTATYGLFVIDSGKYDYQKRVKISMIQANFDPWRPEIDENLKVEFELTRESIKENPDLVVWSESSLAFPFNFYLKRRNSYALKVDSFIRGINRGFLLGAIGFEGKIKNRRYAGRFYNMAYFYNPISKRYEYYKKIHLVPFGEWFPYKKLFPFVAKTLEKAGAGDFKPGNKFTVFKYRDLDFSVLICFEDVFGNLARKFVKEGSDLLINITNDAWSGSKKAEIQHFTISVFRAVENRVPLVRVANGGVTGYVDAYGRVIKTLPLFKRGYLVEDIYYNPQRTGITLYTRYGDFLPLGMMVILMLIGSIYLILKILDILPDKNNM